MGTNENELKNVTSFTEKIFLRFFVQKNPGQSPENSWTKSCPVIFWTMSSFFLDDKFYSFSCWGVLFFNDRIYKTLRNYFSVTKAPIKIDSENLSNFRPIRWPLLLISIVLRVAKVTALGANIFDCKIVSQI